MDQDKKFKVTIPFGEGIINGTIKRLVLSLKAIVAPFACQF